MISILFRVACVRNLGVRLELIWPLCVTVCRDLHRVEARRQGISDQFLPGVFFIMCGLMEVGPFECTWKLV